MPDSVTKARSQKLLLFGGAYVNTSRHLIIIDLKEL